MYTGNYDQEAIILKKELDRKRFEEDNDKFELILYQADYEFLNNKEIQESRVLKFIAIDHDITYHFVKIGANELNNLDNLNSLASIKQISDSYWVAEDNIPTDINEIPCEILLITNDDWDNKVCLNEKALNQWAEEYDDKKDKELEISFLANVDEADIEEVKRGFQKSGSEIISNNFPELNHVANFDVEILNNLGNKNEIKVSFYAEVPASDFEEVEKGFQKSGADIIADNFPELENIGYFKILEEVATLNDFKEEVKKYEKMESEEKDSQRNNNDEALHKWAEEYEENRENVQNNEHYLSSPPPPVIDGVAIRIDGLNDVTEREAKNYINLVVEKIQENARKNLSSITVSKQEDGHIKLDYVIHHEKFERIRRITGYLVGSTDRWNNAKKAEESERVKHIGKKDFISGFKDLCEEHNVSPKKAAKLMVTDILKQNDNKNNLQR